ncbi:FMN-binding protein [Demequina mangrovi]|nr:FMN-binding protein [Demequina mangrovi]
MKRSSGIIVTGISATLLSAGAVMGTGFLEPDASTADTAAAAEPDTAASTGSTGSTASETAAPDTADSSTALDTPAEEQTDTSTDSSTDAAAPSETATAEATDTGVYDGEAISSRYGVFQAEITVEGGTITAIDWLQSGESDHHSQQINDYAMPVLEDAILEAQSVDVGYVSGASFTSEAVEDAIYSAMQVAGLA